MAWRLHLTNQAVQHLDIIDGRQPLLAAWSRRDRVAFYNLANGTVVEERTLAPPPADDRRSESWQAFIGGLVTPYDAYLPSIRLANLTVLLTDDGRMRLYYTADDRLYLDNGEQEIALDMAGANSFVALALDRFLGFSAALDRTGRLHIYQQHIRVGDFDLGLSVEADLAAMVAIARGGGSIFASDGRCVVLTDSSGRVRRRLDPHYTISQMACSPDGRHLALCDEETGVIRVYDGEDLSAGYQRFAIDLVAKAVQVQLLAEMPPPLVALKALTVANNGTLAFAMSGVICVTDLSQLDRLPRPQTLL